MKLIDEKMGSKAKQWLFVVSTPVGLGLLLASLIAINPIKPAISEPSATPLQQRRIMLLEHALAPQTAQEAALTWAKGVKTRNGALQFAVLSGELRSKKATEYTNLNWVTGASSPWVSSYKISNQKQVGKAWQFEIQYQLMTSGGSAGTQRDRIQVTQFQGNDTQSPGWYITQVSSSYN